MQPSVEATAMNLENTAHAGESELGPMRFDERVLYLDCLAKYAGFFRMSRSSLVLLNPVLSLTI